MKTPLLRDYNAEIELNANQKENDEKQQRNSMTNKIMKKESITTNNFYLQTDLTNTTNSSPNLMIKTPLTVHHNHGNNQTENSCSKKCNSPCSNNQLLLNLISSPGSIRSNQTILNGTNSSILCRICYGSDSKEILLQPCNCSGTMGLMHRTCLERWLSQSNSTRCEICQFDFSSSIKKVPKTFSQWLFRPLSTKDNKNLFNDFVCFLILTPLASISTWYCILFALRFHESENRWEAAGLVVLTTFLLFIYVLWFIFSCKYHYKVFKDWQKKNQIVTLRLNEDEKVIARPVLRLKPINQIQYNTSSNETLIQLENEASKDNQHDQEHQNQRIEEENITNIDFATKNNDLNNIEIRMQINVVGNNENGSKSFETCLV